MIPFHSVCPELAGREIRSVKVAASPQHPAGEFAFVEFYCEDLNCDCRRVLFEVRPRAEPDRPVAYITYGWESPAFYERNSNAPPDIAREMTIETVNASLDPMNPQSALAPMILQVFRDIVATDPEYVARLKRHYTIFRDELRRGPDSAASPAAPSASEAGAGSSPAKAAEPRVPVAHRERFDEVAALLEPFGRKHLDPELTGFVMELWRRICRRKSPDCLRGKPSVWAAAITHVIARMNFLSDREQPVHLTFDTVCDFFQANKNTIGGKATEIERTLRLRQHCEPGLCRREFLETFTTVRLSNGMVLTWAMAKTAGYVPPDARVEDLL